MWAILIPAPLQNTILLQLRDGHDIASLSVGDTVYASSGEAMEITALDESLGQITVTRGAGAVIMIGGTGIGVDDGHRTFAIGTSRGELSSILDFDGYLIGG